MTDAWPWLALAGLGAFHGLNPAMGWLFAVALGLNRQSRAVVVAAMAPIALGHLLSTALVAALFVFAGILIDTHVLLRGAGLALIAWAAVHAVRGHRGRVRVGMRAGFAGLALWSFLMATAHGAGLMLVPALIPICFGGAAPPALDGAPLLGAAAGVLLHAAAMLATTCAVALAVYEWLGLAFLQKAWINFDLLWTLALATAGAWLLIS